MREFIRCANFCQPVAGICCFDTPTTHGEDYFGMHVRQHYAIVVFFNDEGAILMFSFPNHYQFESLCSLILHWKTWTVSTEAPGTLVYPTKLAVTQVANGSEHHVWPWKLALTIAHQDLTYIIQWRAVAKILWEHLILLSWQYPLIFMTPAPPTTPRVVFTFVKAYLAIQITEAWW